MKPILASLIVLFAACATAVENPPMPPFVPQPSDKRINDAKAAVRTAIEQPREHPPKKVTVPIAWPPGQIRPRPILIPVKSPKLTSLESGARMKRAESAPHAKPRRP